MTNYCAQRGNSFSSEGTTGSEHEVFICGELGMCSLISNQCFSTSAKLCIWRPNAFIIRHPRVPVYMPVKHLFFPVESSVGMCVPPTLPALDVSSGVNLTMRGSSVENCLYLKVETQRLRCYTL